MSQEIDSTNLVLEQLNPKEAHCNIKANNQHLGRLYVFEVTEPELLAVGITKQWFLTHKESDRLLSGHINSDNQWSLSADFSLEPNLEYLHQSELFSQVFNKDFELPQEQEIISQEKVFNKDFELPQEQEIISQEISTVNVPKLNDELLQPPPLQNPQPSSISSLQPPTNAEQTPPTQTSSLTDQQIALEEARKQLEELLSLLLIDILKEPNQSIEDQQELNSLWVLERDLETGVCQLRFREDNHLVLAVNSDKEVIKSLSLEDAQIAASILLNSEYKVKEELAEVEEDLQQSKLQRKTSQIELN